MARRRARYLFLAFELSAENGGGYIREAEVISGDGEIISALRIHPLTAKRAEARIELRIVYGYRSAFAAGQQLIAEKGERRHFRQLPHYPPLICGQRRFGRVFDHPQSVDCRNVVDPVHVRWMAQ